MLQRKDIARLIGISTTLAWQWQKSGFMPKPDIMGNPCLWRWSVIREFCKTKNFVRANA
jgi:hypothetical protein